MVHDGALMSGILSGYPFMYLLLKQECVCLPFITIIIMGHGFCYTLIFLNPFSDEKGWSLPWLMRVCGLIRGFPSFLKNDFLGLFSIFSLFIFEVNFISNSRLSLKNFNFKNSINSILFLKIFTDYLPLWIRVYNDNTTSNNSFQIVYTVFEVIP
jgi:hypothetical protein